MGAPWEKYQKEEQREASKGGPPPIPDDGEPPDKRRKDKPKKPAKPITNIEQVQTGMADPIHGGAQFLTHLLPEGVVNAGNRLNNWLADQGVPLARIPEGGVDQMVADRESEYQARRAAAGESGMDWGRLTGNVLSPVNAAVASRIPAVGSLGVKMAGGATGGIALSALSPTSGEYWPEKGKQMAIGGIAGGALPAITQGLSRVIRPQTRPEVTKLLKEGVELTPGQIGGGMVQRTEDALVSAPFAGDAVKQAQMRGLESFNRTAINRSLKPLGKTLPKGIKAGREAIDYAINSLDDAYDDLLPKLSGSIDDQFKGDVNTVFAMGQNMAKPQADQLKRIIKNEIISRFTKQGNATGTTIKEIESKLGVMSRDFGRSENYDVRNLSGAVTELQAALRRMVERANPAYSKELTQINSGYANLLRVQKAAGAAGAREGIFTGSQLQSAVRALDPSKNKRAFARGEALMQDLSEPAKSVMSQTVPDSGTPLRLMVNNPLTAAYGGIKAIPAWMLYSRPGTKAAELALTARPSVAAPVSKAIQQASPYLTPGVVSLRELSKNETP